MAVDFVAVTTTPPDSTFASTASSLPYRGGHVRIVYGRVDESVESVVIHTRAHRGIQATVAESWFAAWWPTRRYESRLLADLDPTLELTTKEGESSYFRLRAFPKR